MSQSLHDISLEAFVLQLYKIDSKTLVRLNEDIQQYVSNYASKLDIQYDENIDKFERMATRIQKELMRRKYLQKYKPGETALDYQKHVYKTKKKRLW